MRCSKCGKQIPIGIAELAKAMGLSEILCCECAANTGTKWDGKILAEKSGVEL